MNNLRSETRGAALIVAILILAILLVVVLTFFNASRQEVKFAENVRNETQANLLAEGGTAMAIATLNRDFVEHPTVTSLDFPWKSFFDGSAFVGKPWMWKNGVPTVREDLNNANVRVPLAGVPEIDLTLPQLQGTDLGSAQYVPRVQAAPSATPLADYANDLNNFLGAFPMVVVRDPVNASGTDMVSPVKTVLDGYSVGGNTLTGAVLDLRLLAPEQIDRWADVDNDGDNLRDSIYLPMGMDVFLSDDGLDNDLDYDGTTATLDEDDERGVFVYWGGNDQLDNDRDNTVDELDEQQVFLTAPLRYPDYAAPSPFANIPVADRGQFLRTFVVQADLARLRKFAYPDGTYNGGPAPAIGAANLTIDQRGQQIAGYPQYADRLDNDYDLFVNDSYLYAYQVDPANVQRDPREYNRMNMAQYFGANWAQDLSLPAGFDYVMTFSGEPVCEIMGRVAVLITDESSKVNLNAAGALSYNPNWTDTLTVAPLQRVMFAGMGPDEFELRVLPAGLGAGVGVVESNNLRNFLMGAPGLGAGAAEGIGFAVDYPTVAVRRVPADGPFAYDMSLPGYGRADDDGTVLALAMNGVDDDGDGQVDEGLNPFVGQAWDFEGIDDPQEFQTYRLRRNELAEINSLDDNFNEAVDEIGELGDRVYRATDATKLVAQIAAARYTKGLRETTSVHSSEANHSFARSIDNNGYVNLEYEDKQGNPLAPPAVSGTRLDFDYATPRQIYEALKRDFQYPDLTLTNGWNNDGGRFARGLRREDMTTIPVYNTSVYTLADPSLLGGLIGYNAALPAQRQFLADADLQAAQMAVSIQDGRDGDLGRSTLETSVDDAWWGGVSGQARPITYTSAGMENIRINELMVRPVRRVEAEMLTPAGATNLGVAAAQFLRFDPNLWFDPSAYSIQARELAISGRVLMTNADATSPLDFNMEQRFLTNGVWTPPWNAASPPMGWRSSVTTQTSLIPINQVEALPNVAQFRFAPGPQLPPGRYYLLMNHMFFDTAAGQYRSTIQDADDMRFMIKYERSRVANSRYDLVDDVERGAVNLNAAWPEWRAPVIPAQPNGWVFLPSDASPLPNPSDTSASPPPSQYTRDEAFTVEIPPYADPLTPDDQIYLYVAVWMPPTNGDRLAVNFFEFSQEPDHEWVELANVAEFDPQDPRSGPIGDPIEDRITRQSVNVGGWQIAIGDEAMLNSANGVTRPTVLTIPPDTLIPPGGRILVGVNKFDPGMGRFGTIADPAVIYKNGIALTSGDDGTAAIDYSNVTSIPEQLVGLSRSAFPPQWDAFVAAGYEPTFLRIVDSDYLDESGNMVADATAYSPALFNSAGAFGVLSSSVGTATVPAADVPFPVGGGTNKAWDRVVEATNVMIANSPIATPLRGIGGVQGLADLLCRGGIFPNYPERDGVDNDGDFRTLAYDGVDNDGDGIVDELRDGTNPVDAADNRPEGIDEGGSSVRIGGVPGGYSNQPTPYFYNLDPLNTANDATVNDDLGGVYEGAPPVDQDYPLMTGVNVPADLADDDPPEWKAFMERRWYPGDNVPVTLFAGTAFSAPVVDKVTYNERDVTNRAVDDVVSCSLTNETTGLPETLNPLYPSLWPDDSMPFDFYRSLERKHPLATGDTHGVTNRWQATDGAYDDWAPSTGRWQYVFPDPTGIGSEFPTAPFIQDRLYSGNAAMFWNYSMNLFGSPLRMNMSERILEDPDDNLLQVHLPGDYIPDVFWAFREVRVPNRPYGSEGDLLRMPHLEFAQLLAPPNPNTAVLVLNTLVGDIPVNASFNAAGVAPNVTYAQQAYFPTFRRGDDGTNGRAIEGALQEVLLGQNTSGDMINAALVDPSEPRPPVMPDIQAVTDISDFDPILLAAGTADFYPITPQPIAYTNEVINWDPAMSALPQGWVPVFLHPLGENPGDPVTAVYRPNPLPITNANYRPEPIMQFLFNERPADTRTGALTAADLLPRWPLELRTVVYASGNTAAFTPGAQVDHNAPPVEPARAMFVWDGADGLEDGDYDAYIVTAEDLGTLRDANAAYLAATGNDYMTAFGSAFVQRAMNTTPSDTVVDAEFFTDLERAIPNGSLLPTPPPTMPAFNQTGPDARCWYEDPATGDGYPQLAEFNRGQFLASHGLESESFGRRDALRPSGDGIIYYGTVRVKNNYLALLLTNWSAFGQLNRFTRVVLTPRQRTLGRINLNTVVTREVPRNDGTAHQWFNPVMGIPGILGGYDPGFDAMGYPAADENIDIFDTTNPLATDPPALGWPDYPTLAVPAVEAFDLTGLSYFQRARMIEHERPEHPDGRYYVSPGTIAEGVTPKSGLLARHDVRPPILSNYDVKQDLEVQSVWIQNVQAQFREVAARYSRTANLVSTRSDVFEIIVTAQTGYVPTRDINGDGRIDWRNDFVVTGEKKTRTIYER